MINNVRLRQTIKHNVSLSGIGVHSGQHCNVTVKPLHEPKGILFKRIDEHESDNIIPGISDSLCRAKLDRRTTLSNKAGVSVCTIEHLMASLYCLGIDDALVEVDSLEMPILDGSARMWVDMLSDDCQTPSCDSQIAPVAINRELSFQFGNSSYSYIPSEGFRVTCFLNTQWRVAPKLSETFDINSHDFTEKIAPARTFCLFHEIELALKMNLIKGGSLNNAVVLGRKSVLNPDGLRFADEPLRHKVLDFLGDLSLVSQPMQGHFIIVNPGHMPNAMFIDYLVKDYIND